MLTNISANAQINKPRIKRPKTTVSQNVTIQISKHYLPLLEKVTNVRGNCSVSSCCSGFRMCITVVGFHSDVEF